MQTYKDGEASHSHRNGGADTLPLSLGIGGQRELADTLKGRIKGSSGLGGGIEPASGVPLQRDPVEKVSS